MVHAHGGPQVANLEVVDQVPRMQPSHVGAVLLCHNCALPKHVVPHQIGSHGCQTA